MRYRVVIAGRTVEVVLGPQGVHVDGERVSAELRAVPDGPVRSLLLDGASHRLVAHRSEPGLWDLQLRGWRLAAEVVDFEEEMRAGKVDWQVVSYGNAVHGFTHVGTHPDNSKGYAYNEKADKRSWRAMKDFFGEIFTR